MTGVSAIPRDRGTKTGQLIMLLAATLLGTVSNNIVNVPLRAITADLHAGLAAGVLVVSAFILVLAVSIPLTGWVGDRFGRSRTLLAALLLMAAAMLGAAVANSLPMLVAFRAIQGLACAAIPPSVMGMLSTIYGPHRRASMMSAWAAANGLGQALGPPLGGALASLLGWRSIFWVLAPLSVAVFAGCLRSLPASDGVRQPLHWPGAVTLTVGVTFLISSATVVGLAGIPGWFAVGLAALGIGCVAVFAVVSMRARHPLIDPRMIVETRFRRSGAAAFAMMFSLGAVVVAVPLYATGPMRLGAAATGVVVLVLPAMMALAAPAVGWLCSRSGPRIVLRSGLAVLAVADATIGCWLGAGDAGIVALLGLLTVTGLGIALVQTPAATGATRSPAGRSGAVLGLFSLLRFAGSALGTAWVAIVYPHGNLPLLFGGCAVMALAGVAVSFSGANPAIPSD